MALTTKILSAAIAAIALGPALVSCSDSATVSGSIEGTDGTTVYLENQNNYGRWIPLDSATVTGDFSFKLPDVSRADIYRLRVDNHYIYFPVTGPEQITVEAELATADTRSRLSGSPQAELMDRANSMIADILAKPEAADSLKRELYTQCLAADTLGLVSYYVVTRRIDGRPVYDPAVRRELGIIGAVANSYSSRRPDDPRTALLNDYYLSNRPRAGRSVSAEAITIPEIVLSDDSGTPRSLNALLNDNKVVILSFTAYAADQSGALNLELRKIYDALHERGLDIYQADVLSDRATWRHTAVNLPWTTVYTEDNEAGLDALRAYQVSADRLPLTFVLTADGITRVDDLSRLHSIAASKL